VDGRDESGHDGKGFFPFTLVAFSEFWYYTNIHHLFQRGELTAICKAALGADERAGAGGSYLKGEESGRRRPRVGEVGCRGASFMRCGYRRSGEN
jgi:hypothetical protein